MLAESCAYLDIETTGLDPDSSDITVLGIYIEDESGEPRSCEHGRGGKVIQLVGEDIRSSRLAEIFKDIKKLFTYNGEKFDLPFIRAKLGIDLQSLCQHVDLMHICWQNNLYGGFKKVERRLGITRELEGIDGKEAVFLWHRYAHNGDETALKTLLKYNEEDVKNLKHLKQKLLEILDYKG
ncbi:MAG: ribonuclease H-like domain-containing protein [Candidatus Omnitrophica bacterium]|nr:ribonuclease H-like domain-containing protein [Candidatus Omnitrophota bacterium]